MNDLLSFWDSIGRPKLLVLGDIILDQYTWGDAERVSPEAPVLVLKVEMHEARLGGAACVAGLLRGLEADVTVAGVIGNDAPGRVAIRLLNEAGVDSSLVHCDTSRPTTSKSRLIGRAEGKHPHHMLRVDEEWGHLLAEDVQQQLTERILKRLGEFDAVLISDYGKGVCRSATARTTFQYEFHERPASGEESGEVKNIGESVHVPDSLAPALRGEGGGEGISTRVDDGLNTDEGVRAIQIRNSDDTGAPGRGRAEDEGDCLGCRREGHYTCTEEKEPDVTLLLKTVIQAANAHDIPVLVDPARIPGCDCYKGATLLKPNRAEAELALGIKIDTPQLAMRAGETLCQQLGLQAAVVTLDRHGMVLSRPGVPSELFPATPRTAYDITGAGDMALAMLGLVIASTTKDSPEKLGAVIPDAIRLANIASGLEVERMGVTAILRREIRTEIRRAGGPTLCKITTLEELQAVREESRQNGKTVVFTNGCFDLLHFGHVSMLEEASRLGDVLIVAMNSDESVRQLKGKDRPVIKQQERSRMLAALECVDHVLIFDDAMPHRLLEAIRPNILVKGGTTSGVVGHEVVESYGGRAVKTCEIMGNSTSRLIQQVRQLSGTSQ